MFPKTSRRASRIAKCIAGACGGLLFGTATSLGTLTFLGTWEPLSLFVAFCYTLLFIVLGMRYPHYFGILLLILVLFSVIDEGGVDFGPGNFLLTLSMFFCFVGFFFMPFIVFFQQQELAALCLICIFQSPLVEHLHSRKTAKS